MLHKWKLLKSFSSLITNCLLQKDGDVNLSKFDLAIKLVYLVVNFAILSLVNISVLHNKNLLPQKHLLARILEMNYWRYNKVIAQLTHIVNVINWVSVAKSTHHYVIVHLVPLLHIVSFWVVSWEWIGHILIKLSMVVIGCDCLVAYILGSLFLHKVCILCRVLTALQRGQDYIILSRIVTEKSSLKSNTSMRRLSQAV